MAVITIPKSASLNLTLSAGTNPDTGNAMTKRVTFTGMNADITSSTNATAAYAIVTAAAPILAYPVARVEATVVTTLEQSA